ncbi:Alkbh4p [Halocaridina rubra]|uniref:Alkbh4p n=1 Tax=Halocaridina rubra TaxID=373956 RepID=A0AAN9A0L0_HALRR
MFHPRPCGCKGQRTCLVCEAEYGAPSIADSWITEEDKKKSYVYCPLCHLAWPGWESDGWKSHPHHEGESIKFPGLKIFLDFLTEEEEQQLMIHIDEIPWDLSQSGRRKQNYGPKCNFKKRKVRTENFCGYPACTKFIQDRFKSLDILKNFQTVEQCSLEYTVERGASIDPHIDDCWIWGERIPTVNFLADCTLTLKRFSGPKTKYNLQDMKTYPSVVTDKGTVRDKEELAAEMDTLLKSKNEKNHLNSSYVERDAGPLQSVNFVRLPMPRRSLLVFYGPPRYEWEHGILREDIKSRRVCITYRELTPTYLSYGPNAEVGEQILKVSEEFWDHVKFYNLDVNR